MVQTMTKTVDPAKAKAYFDDQMSFTTGPIELDRLRKSDPNLNIIDVRAAEDYAKGHIPGSKNLPQDKWSTLEGLRKDQNNILLCYSEVCHLAKTAAAEFSGKGYPVMEMDGGFKAWQGHNLEIEQ